MAEFIEIQWTSGTIDEARKISRFLVQERLVANVKIIPWVESIYLLNGQLETTQESKIVMQTEAAQFDAVKKIIMENSVYQVPEVTYRHIDGGDEQYLEWVHSSLTTRSG